MLEISLHILDISENSVKAGATLVEISVSADFTKDVLSVKISDNGRGMAEGELKKSLDPFFTTRTERKIGLGLPLLKSAAERCGGYFYIKSKPNEGTTVFAEFILSHIDRPPLGNMAGTLSCLVRLHPETDFVYSFTTENRFTTENSFSVDTREIKNTLGVSSIDTPEIMRFTEKMTEENTAEILNGRYI